MQFEIAMDRVRFHAFSKHTSNSRIGQRIRIAAHDIEDAKKFRDTAKKENNGFYGYWDDFLNRRIAEKVVLEAELSRRNS